VLDCQGADAGLARLKDWVASEVGGGRIFPAAPFLPRYAGAYASNRELNLSAIKHYLDVLPLLADLHKMVALFGGKAPHPVTLEAGGVTTRPSIERFAHYASLLDQAEAFIRNQYFDDLVGVAAPPASSRIWVETESGQRHAREVQGRACGDCHYALPDGLPFDEAGRAHRRDGTRAEFFYRVGVERGCIACHTNWRLGETAGHLKVAIDLEDLGQPYRISGQEVTFSASLGIAVYPDDGVTAG